MLPRVSWMDLLPADTAIATRDRDSRIDGNVTEFELDVINRLVKFHDPETIFEIGTFDGRTSLNMAAHARPDAHLYTLDLPSADINKTALSVEHGDLLYIEKPQSGARFIATDVEQKITQLYGDSATYDFEPYFGKMDFVFVDGSHSYDYVLKDSATALQLVRESGVIIWHDYVGDGPTAWPGVRKAIEKMNSNDHRFENLINFAGTAIVYLQVPGPKTLVPGNYVEQPNVIFPLDSQQPEYLLASLNVEISQGRVSKRKPISAKVSAKNIGRTIWLPSGSPTGPVLLGTRLLDAKENWINPSYSRSALPGGPIQPGDSVEFEASIPCPPRGKHIIDFDLVAEGVTWFSRNGSKTVRIPIEVESDWAIYYQGVC
jgi:predicted O-methyltransferase YrrM